jgi:hypothetical protein
MMGSVKLTDLEFKSLRAGKAVRFGLRPLGVGAVAGNCQAPVKCL